MPDTTSDGTQVQTSAPAHLLRPADGLPAVPGYALVRELARGGMGAVYLARDPAFERDVAVKIMHPGCDATRFVIESKITAQLPHPGVPPVYALGVLPDRRPFLAMKLIAGRTLAEELKGAAGADLPRLLGVFERICETVGFAHSRGVVHRDLKPANVMVGSFGEVQVMDWGLAKSGVRNQETEGAIATRRRAGPGAEETVAGAVKGTPAYMAPEQARGEPVDARADVFALGGILAAILTGNPPFLGDTVLGTVMKAARAELGECFEELDECGADEELIAVAKTCLSSEREDRYADGREVAAAIAEYRLGVEERLQQAERDTAAAEVRAVEQRRQKRLQMIGIFVMAVVMTLVGYGQQWYERRGEKQKQDAARAAERAQDRADAEAERAAQQASGGVDVYLLLATDLRKQYKFDLAGGVLEQGERLAAENAPDRLEEVRQARRELDLVVKLDDIRYRKWLPDETDGRAGGLAIAAPEYAAALAAFDLDIGALPPDEAARRVAASPIKAEIVAALDDWALYPTGAEQLKRALAVSRAADPGPWTDRLRDPEIWGKRDAIDQLAKDVNVKAVSSAALGTLAELMRRRNLDPSPMLTAARAEHPKDFELAFALAQRHTLETRDDRQISAYAAAGALRPDNPTVWHNLGGAYFRRGDYAAALTAYRTAVKLRPNSAYEQYNLGLALGNTGDMDGALAANRECIRLNPNYAPAHNNVGIILSDRGDKDGALVAYREAVRLDPKYFKGHYNIGGVLHRKGELGAAIDAYKACLGANPQYADAHEKLGDVYREKGDLVAAVAAYRAAVKIAPDHPRAYHGLGQALAKSGDLDAAIVALRRAVDNAPKFADARAALAAALREKIYVMVRKDDPNEGLVYILKEAIAANPKDVVAHTDLGVIYGRQKRFPLAVTSARTAIKLDPKYAEAHALLGLALQQMDKLDEARDALTEAARLNPLKFAALLSKLPKQLPLAPAPRPVDR